MLNSAIAEMSQHYNIPSFGTAGVSDAHVLDEQSALECAMGLLLNALSGSNLVHDVGWLGSASSTSNELLLLCNEVIGYVKHFVRGIDTDLLRTSVEELIAVGPGGNFVDRDLTLDLFKQEVWYPDFLSRAPFANWAARGTPLRQQLADGVAAILEGGNRAALTAAVSRRLRQIAGEEQ
jgi:trimethylamine--corrinoid protein Co-methyltransferase